MTLWKVFLCSSDSSTWVTMEGSTVSLSQGANVSYSLERDTSEQQQLTSDRL